MLFVTERDSVKYGNVKRSGRASMCVTATIEGERWFATAEVAG